MDTKKILENVQRLKEEPSGCIYYPLERKDGNQWAMVFGYEDGEIVGKIAYQSTNSIMQCDYDIDWTMPYDEVTMEVDDTHISITCEQDIEWLLEQWKRMVI